jgi:hypothetical protein
MTRNDIESSTPFEVSLNNTNTPFNFEKTSTSLQINTVSEKIHLEFASEVFRTVPSFSP